MKQRLSDADAERMEVLLDKGNQGTLSNAEKPELDRLVDQVNLHMLLRSKALLILKQRGHDDNALHQYLT